jgi:radical SAM superfamily enzyme YgiQ (UPF0313 family)
MKLLLVNPYFNGLAIAPTLGLGFLGTYIKDRSDCEVEIIEPIQEPINEKYVLKKTKNADVVGLVCYTESRFDCFDFAKKVKEINKSCKVVVGGPHVTSLDRHIIQYYPFVDAVIRGEGEDSLLEIVNNKPFKDILGITWRNGKKIIRNPDRPLIRNIDSLYYDYSLVFENIKKWKDVEVPYDLQKLNHLPIIASRGCPFRCAFCASHSQWGNISRWVSPETLVKTLEYLYSQYNVKYFRFYDALFIGYDKRIMEFCKLLKKSKLDIHFRIDIRVGTSKTTLENLRKVGCDVVGFGVESGSNRILKRINKGITRNQIDKTIKICKELGYWTIGFFMISLPDETRKDIKKTMELFNFFDVYNLQFFKIHPNTAIYRELKQKNEISDDIWFNRKYGNEIFYSRDLFPSANFYKNDVKWLMRYCYYNYNIHNPHSVSKRCGLVKSMIILSLSAMNIPLKGGVDRLLYKLKDTDVYGLSKVLYGKPYRK